MPKGIPNKKKVEQKVIKEEVKHEKKEETKETKHVLVVEKPAQAAIAQKLEPLAPGQAYFEDGPTGTVMIGDATRDQVWFRAGNGGKGCWINKKR